jgi:hypothetical protein
MIDTLKLFEIFKSASFSDEHAHAMTLALQRSEFEVHSDLRLTFERERDFNVKTFVTKSEFEARIAQLESRMDSKIAESESRVIRWMFIFWTGQTAVTAGLIFEAVKLFK